MRACTFALLVALAACAGKHRPFADEPLEGLEGSSGVGASSPAEQSGDQPDPGPGPETSATGGEPVGGAPIDTLSPLDQSIQSSGNGLACEVDAGACSSPDAGPVPAACVATGQRDCTSDLDNDCDGQPDSSLDDVCICLPGTAEPCDEHPGFDGRGQCRAGTRTCIAAEGNVSSDWGACEGAQGPLAADTCVPQDDGDCDGFANEGCDCVDGVTQPCGPPSDLGVCQRGTQTCIAGSFGACVGAMFGTSRDCRSNADNDCDGRPDNTIDNICTCTIGSSEPCGQHPQDGVGQCHAGQRQCQAGQNNSSSFFGQCNGSVGPAQRDCRTQEDNDCNGRPDNTIDNVCTCAIGTTRACETHPGQDGVGQCRAGSQQCLAGQNNTSSLLGACNGSVDPAQRDACTSVNDADCDGLANDGCQCVSSRGNADCSNNADSARCNGTTGQCVPCQSNADCSLVSGGRNICQAGHCVSPIRPLGESCTAGNQCESGVCDPFYQDNDRDSFAPRGAVAESFCSAVGFTKPQYTRLAPTSIRNTDCLDTNIDVSPGQAAFFTQPAGTFGFDYNCSGVVEKNFQVVVDDDVCATDGADGTCSAQGIVEDTPCGETMVAGSCISQGPNTCRLFFADSVGTRACH
jgi:hypothetical protein